MVSLFSTSNRFHTFHINGDWEGRTKRSALEMVFEQLTRLSQEVNNACHDCVDEQHKFRKRNPKK